MNSKIDEEKIRDIRKLFAVSLIEEGAAPEEAAAVADAEMFRMQQQWACGAGELKVEKSVDNCSNRNQARFCVWFEKNAPMLFEKGNEFVDSCMESFLGNQAKGEEIRQSVGTKLGISSEIKKGADEISGCCSGIMVQYKVRSLWSVVTGSVKGVFHGLKD